MRDHKLFRIVGERESIVELGHFLLSVNISSKKTRKRDPAGKKIWIFFVDTLKLHVEWISIFKTDRRDLSYPS